MSILGVTAGVVAPSPFVAVMASNTLDNPVAVISSSAMGACLVAFAWCAITGKIMFPSEKRAMERTITLLAEALVTANQANAGTAQAAEGLNKLIRAQATVPRVSPAELVAALQTAQDLAAQLKQATDGD
jgi:hypothetical protein